MSIVYRRSPQATERRVGESVFLANPEYGTLYRLSETVAALWNLLETPTDIHGAVEVFQQAFPDQPAADVEDQVTEMFFDLIEEGLVEPNP